MKDRFEVIYKEVHSAGLEKRIIYVDKETDVNYLYVQNGYSGGMTPLLDVALLVLFGTALSSCVNFPLSTNGQGSAVGTITAYYDIRSDRYWVELLEQVGFDTSKLPEILDCGQFVETLSEAAQRDLGLPLLIVLFVVRGVPMVMAFVKSFYNWDGGLKNVDYRNAFLNEDGSVRTDMYADGLHPNAKGHATMAEVLCQRLNELFPTKQ